MLLVVFGSGQRRRPISVDEFWYRLYTGEVESPVVGRDRVTGRLAGSAAGDRSPEFVVELADALSERDLIQELSAKEAEEPQPLGAFLAGVEEGSILPLKAYPLRFTERTEPGRLDSPLRTSHRLFIDYADARGTHYAEVVGTDPHNIDLAAVLPALRQAGAEVVSGLTFDAAHPTVTNDQDSLLLSFLLTFGPILLLVALFWFLFLRQMRGQGQGLMSFGRSRAVMYNKEKSTGVTFADVAGIDEAKEDVQEIIEFLRNPEKFSRLGGRIPRGVLLVGQPGTGKTLLAKAIAGEAGVPFFSISGSDFVEMFVGVGASRVRDLFKQARDSAPCIVFLDEIDAVGRKRGSGLGGGHDEREQTLNAILVEMDGFSTDEGIILMAATNRPDVLDPALLRPGRFDREIVIDLPDLKGREAILGVHVKKVRRAPDVDLAEIARGTPGFSGAELAALVNEAAIIAAMRGHEFVTRADFDEARDKVAFGREKKSRVLDPEDKRITAFHEAGHAVVNCLLEHTEPVHKVTIIPRGMALGATMMLPEKDRMHLTRKKLLDELAVLYGGRVAEEVFCDDITSGAANDIQRATHLAKLMVTEWGMSDRIGPVNLADRVGSEFLGAELTVGKDHAEATVREIDQEIIRLLDEARSRARAVIEANRAAVERLAEALIRHETLSGAVVRGIVAGRPVEELLPPPRPTAAADAAPAPAAPPPLPATRPAVPPGPGEEGLSPA
ncbi:MAG: ATP-dependent zinc metalloprotease FtsH [Planctomycetota bacterium]|nr:MAG: ATP-dependent zinc metalloprotease FtsH [Planctomycetota bacterium]